MSQPTTYTTGRSESVGSTPTKEGEFDDSAYKTKPKGSTPTKGRVVSRRLFTSPSPTKKGKGGTPITRRVAIRSRASPRTTKRKGSTLTVAQVAREASEQINTSGTILQTPRRQGIPRPTVEQLSENVKKQREAGVRMYRNVTSKIKKIENAPPRAKRELFPNNKKNEKRVKLERQLELKNYVTKADFNKLVEKLDKPRTPAAQQLTKSNITELLKPLINKKMDGPKYSLFGSFYPKNKKDGKPLFSRKPESVVRDIAKSASKKFRKEIVTKVKAPKTPVLPVTRMPTSGQRKKHVIELIDRVIKKMKVSRDTEKKIIDFYEALSEKYIKGMFGGKSKEEVRSIIKKQVDFFNKKKKR